MTHPNDGGPALKDLLDSYHATGRLEVRQKIEALFAGLQGPALKPSDEARRLVDEDGLASAIRAYVAAGKRGLELSGAMSAAIAEYLEATPQNAGEAKPVAWGEFYGDKCASVDLVKGRHHTEPLYRTSPPAATDAVLREALRRMIYETTSLSPMEMDGSHWCRITAACLQNARAALQATATGEKP